LKPFSFVHVADLHLGYAQYGLQTRRDDFLRVFEEIAQKTIELKPDFMIIAGDLFEQARPSNVTLEEAIRVFRRLKEAGIPVLAVDGSHDSAPNVITGTILTPLDSAGLIHYLPRHQGACWRNENCYVYGIPNFRTRRKTEELLPQFLEQNKPMPNPDVFNIFVFHMAVELPSVKPPYMEAEVTPEMIPEGFNYYAGGHIHQPFQVSFKGGVLSFSGSTETVSYEDAVFEKSFNYVKVNEKGKPLIQRIKLESPRRFLLLDKDYSNMLPSKITTEVANWIKEADEEGVIIVPILKGTLPPEASRSEVDVAKIRAAAEKALYVHVVLRLTETMVSEEIVRSIFETELKDLKTKSFEYFLQIFLERYPHEEAEKIARLAVSLIEPLARKHENQVKKELEAFFK